RKHDRAADRTAARTDFDAAIAATDHVLLRPLALVNRAVLSHHEKRHAEAIEDLKSAINLHPEGQAAYVNLARVFQELGQLEEARGVLDLALCRWPHAFLLFESRSQVQLARSNRAAARADLEQAIACEPPGMHSPLAARCRITLGRLNSQEGEYAAALMQYEK